MNSYLKYFRNRKIGKFNPGGTLTPEEEAKMHAEALQSATHPTDSYINPDQLQSIAAMPAPNIHADMQGLQNEATKRQREPLEAEGQKKAQASSLAQQYGVNSAYIGEGKGQMSAKGAAAVGVLSDVGVKALDTLDNNLMGDKNFGAQSAAIDAAVNGASDALIKSGNPYAMAAGVGLKGVNFLTKAGGQTVEGYDVNIDNSGYGNLAHQDASSSRDFAAAIGLGGFNLAKQDAKLARRNEKAQMALKAANISDNIKFEQEARMNSVDDVLRQNSIALAGGLDSSLLAAKKGSKLMQKKPIRIVNLDDFPTYKILHCGGHIPYAQNGARLQQIEVSEQPSVIPGGDLHKNKHADFGIDVTEKGIPVITVADDSAETLQEIQKQADTVVQHAEVEKEEVILNKSLTDFVEDLRKKWHETNEQDDSICLEAGMHLAKELIENTEDNTTVTEKAQKQI